MFLSHQVVYMVFLVSFWQTHLSLQLDIECFHNGTTLTDNIKIFLNAKENGTSNLLCMDKQTKGFVKELKMNVSSSDTTDLVTLKFSDTSTTGENQVLDFSGHDIFKIEQLLSFNVKPLVCEIYYVNALHEDVRIVKFWVVTAHKLFSQYQRTFSLDNSNHMIAESPCSNIVSYWIPKMLSKTKNCKISLILYYVFRDFFV